MKKICVVASEFPGPVRNGGIATHLSEHVRILNNAGYDVTVYYSGRYEHGSPGYWQEFYRGENIRFVPAPEHKPGFLEDSMAVFDYLRSENFDVVHFGEWRANGFIPLQAKRAGIAFADALLTVTMHGSSQWVREAMLDWPKRSYDGMLLDYCERYCVEHADVLVTSNNYMLDWAVSKGWKPATKRAIVPNYLGRPEMAGNSITDQKHIAFFGRLETRKGLEVFVDAVDRVLSDDREKFKKLTFLGKFSNCRGPLKPRDYILNLRGKYPHIEVMSLTDLDSKGAIRFLRDTGAIAVIPSLTDNLPNTVLECIQNSIPFIASNVGGIREVVATAELLFDPTPHGLESALLNLDSILKIKAEFNYDPDASMASWLKLQEENSVVGTVHENAGQIPKISVIIECKQVHASTMHNVIKSSDYTHLEVKYSGPGISRNQAASGCTGDYILFMDGDISLKDNAVDTMIKSITWSGADCLTAHFDKVSEGREVSRAVPLGSCVEAGLFSNIFGSSFFIVRSSVFKDVGGFSDITGSEASDHEFLARLCLEGYRLDVIPEPLFIHNGTADGYTGVDLYLNQQALAGTYAKKLPENLGFLIPGVYNFDRTNITGKARRKRRGIMGRIDGIYANSRNYIVKSVRAFLSQIIL